MAFFYGVNKEVLPLKVCDESLLKPYETEFVIILIMQNVSNLTIGYFFRAIPEKSKVIKASLLAG